MQVSVQTLSGLERQITVAVPADRIETEVKNRLDSLSKRVRISGFRPGKVPLSVIKQHYGSQVQQEVLGELLQSSFYEAVTQEKLRPAGTPNINPKARQAGQPLEYTAVFEIYPEVKLKSFSEVEIEKPTALIGDEDVDRVIENIRKQRMEWSLADRSSKVGDRVRIDFKGTKGGEEFTGNQAQDMAVELGAKRMIPGFEEQLTGVTAGAALSFDLQFPDDYHNKELANQQVHFDVTVKAVEEPRLPEVNADFIRALGIEDGTVEAMRNDVRHNMQREMDERIRGILKQNVMDVLVKTTALEVPKALIEQEVRTLASGRNSSPDAASDPNVKELATRRVTLGLVLSEIVKQQGIKVEPRKLREAIDRFASTYENPAEVAQWYYSDKRRLAEMESYVLENEVVEWVVSQARVKEIATTFDVLIKQAQSAA